MYYSGKAIKDLIESGRLIVEPKPDDAQYQPASLDLRLGDEFCVVTTNKLIDTRKETKYLRPLKVEESFIIGPGEFVLAHTVEYIKLPPDLLASVEGRSSIGRLGLFIENAGHIDPGFEGQITLELFNASQTPIKLYPGMRICQIRVAKVAGITHPYRGKYQHQKGPTPSRIMMDFVD